MQIFIKALTGGGIQAFIKILSPWRNADLHDDTYPSLQHI